MQFRDILLCVDPVQSGSVLIENAVSFAEKQEANLTGLYPLEFPEFPGYVAAQLPKEIIDRNRSYFMEHAKEAENAFRKACTSAGIHWNWHCVEGERATSVIVNARLADLVLLAGAQDDGESATGESSGRIML
jgi:hypothetical protein